MIRARPSPGTMARLTSALPPDGAAIDYHSGFVAGVTEERARRKPPRRIARPRNLTLTPAASAMLDALMARDGGDNASAEASAAILARGEAMGLRVAQGSG